MKDFDTKRIMAVVKVALYIGVSAVLDYLISITSGSEWGTFTPVINIVLVTVRQLLKTEK